jgi:hypothetical protein
MGLGERIVAWARDGGLADLPRIHELELDAKALMLTVGLPVGTAAVFG